MNCDQALRILIEPNHHQREEALSYIVQEPSCLARVDQLARAVLSHLEQETTCAEVQTKLPTYYELDLNQDDVVTKMPVIHAHLGRCPYCQTDYQLLKDAMFALDPNNAAELGAIPEFDLSFLNQLVSDPQTDELDLVTEIWQIRDKIKTLAETIQVTISESSTSIAADVGSLFTPRKVSAVLRGNHDETQYSVLLLPDSEAHVQFEINTIPMRNETLQIALTVFETDGVTPIPDVRVALRKLDGSLISSSFTDPHGIFESPRVLAGGYILQAQHGDDKWEIPLTIRSI